MKNIPFKFEDDSVILTVNKDLAEVLSAYAKCSSIETIDDVEIDEIKKMSILLPEPLVRDLLKERLYDLQYYHTRSNSLLEYNRKLYDNSNNLINFLEKQHKVIGFLFAYSILITLFLMVYIVTIIYSR